MLVWSLLLLVVLGLTTLASLLPAPAAGAIGLALTSLAAAAWVARPEGPRPA